VSEPAFADEVRGPWARRRGVLVDVAVVVVLLLVVLVGYYTDTQSASGRRVSAVLAATQVLTLVLRRVRPAVCLASLAALSLLQVALTGQPTWGQLAVPIAVYSAATYGSARVARAGVAIGLLGAVVGPVDWFVSDSTNIEGTLASIVGCALVVVTSWALGALARTRQAYVGQLIERGVRLEREAAQRAELAASDERARIAREMHDVVAHGLSVMVVQADGARYQLDRDPEVAGRALETIAATGRESLHEMRRMLGLLRSDDSPAGTRPQPGLVDLEHLLAQELGPDVTVEARVAPDLPRLDRSVGQGVGLTVYRVAQEALTNVRKHAGPNASVDVAVTAEKGMITVRVTDDGRGASAVTDGKGHGLIGIRERAALHGGRVEAGPRQGGGFEVLASIPYDDASRLVPEATGRRDTSGQNPTGTNPAVGSSGGPTA
jgi:signal transduction histidine kinase